MNKLIAEGVALLDGHFNGRQWVKRINLDKFHIGSFNNCVVGQLFPNYDNGLTDLGAGNDNDERNNFEVKHGFFSWKDEQALNNAWISFINNEVEKINE